MAEPLFAEELTEERQQVEVGLRPALRHRSFQLLFSGQAVSALGDWILPIVIALELVRRHRPLYDLALVFGSRTIATGLVLVFGGVLADRFRRTRIMVSADLVRAMAIVVVMLGWRALDLPVIAGAMFLFGIGEAIFQPAYSALVPRTVPNSAVMSANAVNTLTQRLADVLGPAFAGLLFATLGGAASLGIDIVTFAISTATLLAIREKGTAHTQPLRRFIFSHAFEGAQVVWRLIWIRYMVLAGIVQVFFFIAPWFVFLPVITGQRYSGVPAYAVCLSCYGIGAIAGNVAASRYRGRRPGLVGLPAIGLLALIMVALALPTPLWLLAAAHFVGGFGIDVFGVLWNTAVQREIPDNLLGRVMSFDLLTTKVATPIAYVIIAPIAAVVGREPVLVLGALACVLPFLPLLALPSVRALSGPPPTTSHGPDLA
jgi:predicted MFS family arabinose efflux permease